MKFLTLTATLFVSLLASGTVLASDSSYLDQRSARLHQTTGERDMVRVSTDTPMVSEASYWEKRSAQLNRANSEIADLQQEKHSARGLILVNDPDVWWR
ncbi:hypothetical protein L861_06460 [Litchfieldella anticariensis FP35 = DSM 16096]|uniref:Uncharacterized protein n=1 Tax=Litchfieldella anticariensis (strain DSM 16096 / CECT 5854 / CIP 108499 / LMG 22089 / FP35) TaxID=1121939 RepID=S2L770_LITA3|nr:hypothetical protein L861_06460 [Halomonas anticariensis FP35 = DSM 16096]